MKAKKKRRKPFRVDEGIEVIDLRDPQGMLSANDRMNEQYAGSTIAYLDERRGMKVYRRIIAHGNDLLAINDAIRTLTKNEQRDVMMHYALKQEEGVIYNWNQTITET